MIIKLRYHPSLRRTLETTSTYSLDVGHSGIRDAPTALCVRLEKHIVTIALTDAEAEELATRLIDAGKGPR
jgi:hypothetical protein